MTIIKRKTDTVQTQALVERSVSIRKEVLEELW